MQKCLILFFFFICFFASCLYSQTENDLHQSKLFRKRLFVASTFSFVGGASHGFNQTIAHHYYAFNRNFPNADERFWNPAISHNNASSLFGYKYDAYHLSNSLTQTSVFTAGCFSYPLIKGHLRDLPLVLIVNFVAYSVGNYVVYDVIFHK